MDYDDNIKEQKVVFGYTYISRENQTAALHRIKMI